MSDLYDTTPLDLSHPATKADVHGAYGDMTPGQKTAFNKTATELRNWKDSLSQAFFGEALNPAMLEGELRGYARDNGLQPEYMQLLTYNLIPKIT